MNQAFHKSPFNYTGSKTNLMPQLLPLFPLEKEVGIFWDVFCGGGSVTVNTPYKNVVMNDIITPLMKIYKDLYDLDLDQFITNVENKFIPKDNQDFFNLKRAEFNESKDPYLFFNLVCSCTNNMMRFNKKYEFNQTYGKRSFNDNTKEKLRNYSEIILKF